MYSYYSCIVIPIVFCPQSNYGVGLPLMVMGVVPLITGLLSLLLPETKGKSLPDTLQQLKNMS